MNAVYSLIMKLFKCQNCSQLLYFENTHCEQCGYSLGFLPSQGDLITLITLNDFTLLDLKNQQDHYRYCANSTYNACNWLVSSQSPDQFCLACKLNGVVPDLNNPDRLTNWRKLEIAKHRLVYTLLKLRLPVSSKLDDEPTGITFEFLAPEDTDKKVVMGHEDGVITINLNEADDVKRVAMREKLHEPYRTLAGHFRHESGHYYWDRLIKDSPQRLQSFRKLFGDDNLDYAVALKNYYSAGAPANWISSFVSAYATAHPWEDWAETWAHYLHIIDTLETAYSHGLKTNPPLDGERRLFSDHNHDPFEVADFNDLIELWYPLTVTINSLNRSMGQPDFYPFVIPSPAVEKLDFIHRVCFKKFDKVNHN
ncbi:putative zinc-binding peptidase [soil metagenome]